MGLVLVCSCIAVARGIRPLIISAVRLPHQVILVANRHIFGTFVVLLRLARTGCAVIHEVASARIKRITSVKHPLTLALGPNLTTTHAVARVALPLPLHLLNILEVARLRHTRVHCCLAVAAAWRLLGWLRACGAAGVEPVLNRRYRPSGITPRQHIDIFLSFIPLGGLGRALRLVAH